MRLGRAILFVKDFDGLLAFYCNTLGLRRLTQDAPGWAELDAGGATLALHAIPSEIAKAISITSPPRRREEMPIKLVFVVPDVESERARLVSLGVSMSELRPWGASDGVDPEGNVFQISAT
jgi:catechol-2,3-dioxygenase